MANVLFIKTSSLGDVIHHMPAIVEARRRRPDPALPELTREESARAAALLSDQAWSGSGSSPRS